jgi:hypothetical protein
VRRPALSLPVGLRLAPASTPLPGPPDIEADIRRLRRYERARVAMEIEIYAQGRPPAEQDPLAAAARIAREGTNEEEL